MIFLHLSDLHLGRALNGFSLIEDQRYILNSVLDIAKEKQADSIMIAGDIYDKKNPSEEAVALFNDFLNKLSDMELKLFAVSGNHDSDVRVNFGSDIFKKNNIYISGEYGGNIKKCTVADEYGDVNIWIMPYLKYAAVAAYFPDKDIKSYDDAIKAVLGSCDADPAQRNIIVAHQFVSAAKMPELDGSELAYASVGTIDFSSASHFDIFDYAALGHIHRPQSVGRNTCRYSGSPLKYSEREAMSAKSVPVVTLKEKGCGIDVELVPLVPMRDVRKLKGELDMLLKNAVDTEDYIIAELTDRDRKRDALARLRSVYPNAIHIFYSDDVRKTEIGDDKFSVSEGSGVEKILSDFYKLVMEGEEPTEEEWKILTETAREAGVLE